MVFIFRNKKAFFTIPVPQFITKLFTKPAAAEPAPENNEPEPESTLIDETPDVPDHFPTEMRGAFIHARTHPSKITTPICSACSVNPNVYPTNDTPAAPAELNEMPLPPDFDDDTMSEIPQSPSSSAPVFQEIKFYDDDEDEEQNVDSDVAEHLNKTNREFNVIDNDFILTNDLVIAVHNDPDFWIMDEPTWFAAGKTRESPIDALLSAGNQHKTKPVLLLRETNIMKLDDKITEWKNKGITVITNLSDL